MTPSRGDHRPVPSNRRRPDPSATYPRILAQPCPAEPADQVPEPAAPVLPHWDGIRRLCLGRRVLREFHRVAPRQAALLAAFEEHGWAASPIRNPFMPEPGEGPDDARRHLRLTVQNLNRALPKWTIRFRDNGDRVWWEPVMRSRRRSR